ncbi:MAG: ferritin-like domain-containing protein [Myxococcales bacterium]|nr:ferritin-like domain-containing protein [Myxococcales bacterium]
MTDDIHALDEEAFFDEVYTFQHWFDSVEGYLHDTRFGRKHPTSEVPSEGRREALISTLCNYCVGETAALEASSGLVVIAPNRALKVFLATQAADEARHLEVFYRRLAELGVHDPEAEIPKRASASLLEFKRSLLELVDARDWDAAIFAQNVVLESMEFTTFGTHMRRTDDATADMLARILRDERRHIGFGETQLGRRLHADPVLKARLSRVRARLDPLVLASFTESLEALGVARGDRPELAKDYLQTVGRLGVE